MIQNVKVNSKNTSNLKPMQHPKCIINEIFKILIKTPPPKKGSTYKSVSKKKL
jgi:hypothetical protein